MENKKLEELLKQNKYDVLQYMLMTDLKTEFDEKEVYELYKYVFSVTEKANSICDPLQITEKDVLDIISVIGNILQNNIIDFNELAIKQEGTELQFINQKGKILNTYKMEAQAQDTRYQPSNLEYAKENIKYRENRLKEMQNIGTQLIKILAENEELFLEKAKKRLDKMKHEIYERKNNKLGGMNNMLNYKISIIKDTMKESLKDLKDLDDEIKLEDIDGENKIVKLQHIDDEIKTVVLQHIDEFFNSIDSIDGIEKTSDIVEEWRKYIDICDEMRDLDYRVAEAIIDETNEKWLEIEIEGLKYVDDESKTNKEFLLKFIDEIYPFVDNKTDKRLCEILKEVVPQELLSDEEFVLGLIKIFNNEHWNSDRINIPECKSIIFCKLFDYIKDNMNPKFRNDLEFFNKINDITALLFLSDELKSDKQLMLKLIEEDPEYYIFMNKEFKIDNDIVRSLLDRIIDEDDYKHFKLILENANIFEDNEIIQLAKQDENAHKEFLNVYKQYIDSVEKISNMADNSRKYVEADYYEDEEDDDMDYYDDEEDDDIDHYYENEEDDDMDCYYEDEEDDGISDSDEIEEESLEKKLEGLKYIDDELKTNKEFLLKFMAEIYPYTDNETDEKLFEILKEVVPQELFSDEEFVLGLIEIFSNEHGFSDIIDIPECKLFNYIKDNMDPKFTNNLEFLNKIDSHTKILFFSDELKKDKQVMLKLIEKDSRSYVFMNKEFKIDDDIIECLIKSIYHNAYQWVEPILEEAEIFEDPEIIELASENKNVYTRYWNLYEIISENKEYFEEVEGYIPIILFFSDELKKDKQVMLKLIEKDSRSYVFMNKEFKIDDDIIEGLIKSVNYKSENFRDFEWEAEIVENFIDEEILQLARKDEYEHKKFWDLHKTIVRSQIGESLEENNKIVTHFGDDLDNKSAIYALQKWAEDNDYIKIGHPIEIVRVPAGQVKEGLLNIDTGGHRGNKVNEKTIVIDGDIENGVKSASESLSKLGIYVPEQIVELADTKPNQVSSLDSRSGLALVRYLNGEQLFKLAEEGLLDKSLSDEQLEKYGLVDAHKKQEEIINTAVEKINKYTKKMDDGEKIVLAPEQILAGSGIAYEMGINYYVSANTHFNKEELADGVTFAITSKPGVKLPEEVLEFGNELVQKYRIDENTSGVFVSPNGQMIVAGGLKNPEFKIENETVDGILEKIESKFTGKDLSKDEKIHE